MSEQPLVAPELRELLDNDDREAIRAFCEDTHPATIAEALTGFEADKTWRVLAMLDIRARMDVFTCLPIDRQVDLVTGARRRAMARLIEEMPSDDRVDLVQRLDAEVRDQILPLIAEAERRDIRKLAAYPEDTAGGEMTSEYVALPEALTVGEALERLRHQTYEEESLYAIYVVDTARRLRGFVSLPALVLARPQRRLADVMEPEVVSCRVTDDREEVVQIMKKYDLFAVPVVNDNDVLVGIVTADDVFDINDEEVDEDIYHLGAAGEPQPTGYLRANPLRIARQRVVWLLLLVLVGFISGAVMQSYGDVLQGGMAVVLASFLPMLMGSGGNAGSQATMVVVRGLATGEVTLRDGLRVVRKEIAVALCVGVALGLVAAGRAMLMNKDPAVALTVAAAMIGVVTLAKALGAALPLLLKRLNLDPALMSAPLIATVMDVATIVLYLQLARWILL